MKILWVKPGKLLPLDTGGKLRTYNIARYLCAKHELTFVSYYNGQRDENYERQIRERLPGAVPVYTTIRDVSGLARVFDYLRRLGQLHPYTISRFTSVLVQKMLREWIWQRRFDVAVCDFLTSASNFPRKLLTPTVLFQHNVESVLWERRCRFADGWTSQLSSWIEWLKMVHYETAQVQRFHHVLAVSETDRVAMNKMTDPSRISVIPTGVDCAVYKYDPDLTPIGPLVVFSGSMDWEPNVDAVEFFCKEIWPHVLAKVPQGRFRIVGRDPRPRVKTLASSSVEVTGTVPSVVGHLREAAVLVVPLRMAGGTRLKIYEGMAMGKATVSTTTGAEGLDVEHERNILLADDPRRFAEHVVNLLSNETLRRQYERAAAMACRRDWSTVAELFAKELQKVIVSISPDDCESNTSRTELNSRMGAAAG